MIGPREIFRHSSKISGASLVGAALSLPAGIVVARILGPELLGTVGIVALWLQYAGWARPGLMAAAYREMPHLLGQGKEEAALRLQNVAMTFEGLAAIVPVAVMLAFAFWYRNPVLRFGLAVAALQFVLQTANYFRGSVQWVFQRFGIVARVTLGNRVAAPLLSLGGVTAAGAYGQLVAPAVLEGLTAGYYAVATPPLRFRPTWDRREALRMLRIGIPLSLLTLLYWSFRIADRTMVASWLPLAQLGFFTFGLNYIALAIQFVADFTNVLQPGLYAELGRLGSVAPLRDQISRLAVLILAITCIGTNLAQAGFGAFVLWLVPKFEPSIRNFEVLAFNLACGTAPILPALLLYSSVLNRQNLMVVVQAAALAVNVGIGYLAFREGWGLPGIALSSVIAQLSLSAAYYAFAHEHLFAAAPARVALAFYGRLAGLLAFAAGIFLVMIAVAPYGPSHAPLAVLATRVGLVALGWGVLTGRVWARGALAARRREAGPPPPS